MVKNRSVSLLFLPILLASPFMLFTPSAVQAQLIEYMDRSHVNLMNAWDATLTFSGTTVSGNIITDNEVRFAMENAASMVGRSLSSTSPAPSFIADFNTIRNFKTLSTHAHNANYGISAATVETSNDGVNWTPRSATFSNPTTASFRLTLDTAVDARYVRVTPTTFQNGPTGTDERWFVSTVRAFGDTGTMAGDTNLTILANGGFSSTQSWTAVGTVSQAAATAASQMIKPNVDPVTRQVLHNIADGEGFKLDLGQNFKVDRGTMNVTSFTASTNNPVTMRIAGSTDDSSYFDLYSLTWTSSVAGPNLFSFNMDTVQDSRYLRVTFDIDSGETDLRVSDMAFYQIPEPTTFVLLAGSLALIMMCLRRRATR